MSTWCWVRWQTYAMLDCCKSLNVTGLQGPGDVVAPPCQISSKSVNLLQWYCDFSTFQDGGILGCIWTFDEEHRHLAVVSITVRNLMANGPVVVVIWRFQYLVGALGFKPPFAPKIKVFGDLTTKWGEISTKSQKGIWVSPRHLSDRAWKSAERSDL